MTSSLAWDSSSLDQELILCLGPVALHVCCGVAPFALAASSCSGQEGSTLLAWYALQQL